MMKKSALTAAALALLMLTGCGAISSDDGPTELVEPTQAATRAAETDEPTTAETTEAPTETETETSSSTKSADKEALDKLADVLEDELDIDYDYEALEKECPDVDTIPPGAVYKCNKRYIPQNFSSTLSELVYFDSHDNPIRSYYYAFDILETYTEYENKYDSDGRLIAVMQKQTTLDDELVRTSAVAKFEYNDHGDVSRTVCVEDGYTSVMCFDYEYDSDGRPAVEYRYIEEYEDFRTEYRREFDSSGNAVTETADFGAGDYVKTMTYDSKGRMLTEATTMLGVTQTIEYEYTDF